MAPRQVRTRLARTFLAGAAILAALLLFLYALGMRRTPEMRRLPEFQREAQGRVAAIRARQKAMSDTTPTASRAEPSLLVDAWEALSEEERAFAVRGPLSTGWFWPSPSPRLTVRPDAEGDLVLGDQRFPSAAVRDKFTRIAMAHPEEPLAVLPGPASPAFHRFLDLSEQQLLADPPAANMPSGAFSRVTARALLQGRQREAETLILRWAQDAVRQHLEGVITEQEAGSLELLTAFLTDALEAGMLKPAALAEIDEVLAAAEITAEEADARGDLAVLEWAGEAAAPPPDARGSSLAWALFGPLYQRRVEATAAALVTNSPSMGVLITMGLAGKLAGVDDRTSLPPLTQLPHPRVVELVPGLPGSEQVANQRIWMARFQVACLRFHLAQGRWPSGAAELSPELLPEDFSARSGSEWYVLELDPIAVPILTRPPDEPSRLALDFRIDQRRPPGSPEELAKWAEQQGRAGIAAPAFHSLAATPTFLRLAPGWPLMEMADGSVIRWWEEPSPEVEERLRFLATEPRHFYHGMALCRFHRNRWEQAALALKEAGS